MSAAKELKQGIDDFHFAIAQAGGDADEAVRQLLLHGAEAIEPISPADAERPLIHSLKFYKDAPTPTGCRVPAAQGWELEDGGRLTFPTEMKVEEIALHAPLVSGLARDDEGNFKVVVAFMRKGKWAQHSIPRSLLAVPQKMAEALMACGAPLNASNAKDVAVWLADFELENQALLNEQHHVSVGGYRADGTVFVTGAGAVTTTGIDPLYIADSTDERMRVLRAVHPQGDYENSRVMIARIFAISSEAGAMIVGSLAAALLYRLGQASGAVHLGGASSHGKTTVLVVAGSCWGRGSVDDPDSIVGTFSSTVVGVEMRAAVLRDLPCCLDEAHLMPAEDRARLVYLVLGGQGKTRGKRDGGLRATSTWRTFLLTTGEGVLVPDNAAAGAQVRVLQLDFEGLGLSTSEVAIIKATAREHYGHLGPAFVAELMSHSTEELRALYVAFRQRAMDLAGATTLDQRQAETIAVLATTEALCSELFGFGDSKGATMLALIAKTSSRKRVETEWERGLEAIASLVAMRRSAFPNLTLESNGRKGYASAHFREVLGFIDSNDKRLHILKEAASTHLTSKGLDASVVMRGLRDRKLLACEREGELGNRPRVNGERPACYSISLAALGLHEDDAAPQGAARGNEGGCPGSNGHAPDRLN